MDRGGVLDGQEAVALDADDCFADFSEYEDAAEASIQKAARVDARSIRTRSRVRKIRAASTEKLSLLLPDPIEDGDAWHVLSNGDVSGISYLAHILLSGPLDHVIISTWCMSLDDVLQLEAWIDDGLIKNLDCYCGEIFASNGYALAVERLCAVIRSRSLPGRVCIFRNHSKVIVAASHQRGYYCVVESSANLNTNPRTEQTVVTRDHALARFYSDFYGAITSKVKNFDGWVPAEWPGNTANADADIADLRPQTVAPGTAAEDQVPDLILVRGVPGSGKSAIASSIRMVGFRHFEADQYLSRHGEYVFTRNDLVRAHSWCRDQAIAAMRKGQRAVVANTFTTIAEMQPYLDAAARLGRSVKVIEATGKWENVHGVPDKSVARMRSNFQPYRAAA